MTFPGTIMRTTTNAIVSPRPRLVVSVVLGQGVRCIDSLVWRISLARRNRVGRIIMRVISPNVATSDPRGRCRLRQRQIASVASTDTISELGSDVVGILGIAPLAHTQA